MSVSADSLWLIIDAGLSHGHGKLCVVLSKARRDIDRSRFCSAKSLPATRCDVGPALAVVVGYEPAHADLERARPQDVQVLHEAVDLCAVVGLEVGNAAGAMLRACRC